MQQLILARRPLEPTVTHVMPDGLTIAAMLERVEGLPPTYPDDFVVTIDGRVVPAEIWTYAKPRPGRTVTVGVRLGKGKTLRLFAMVAIAAAAIAISAGALGPAGLGLGASFAAGGIGATAAAGAVSLGGSLLVGMLFAPPRPKSADPGEGASASSLAANTLAKGGILPRICGHGRRVAPSAITFTLTEVVGEDTKTEAVYALAGPHHWLAVYVGETLAGDLEDFEFETFEGKREDNPITLVTRYGADENVGIDMTEHAFDPDVATNIKDQSAPEKSLPKWHRVTCRNWADEFWITLRWLEGLFDDDDPTTERGMAVRLRFRPVGHSTWFNAPELHVRWRRPQSFQLMVKLLWRQPGAAPTPPTTGGFTHAFVEVPAQGFPPTTGAWQSHSHFDNGSGLTDVKNVHLYNDRAELFLDPTIFPPGRYEVELKHSFPIRTGGLNTTNYLYSGDLYDLFGYYLSTGTARTLFSLSGEHQKVRIDRIALVRNQPPAPKGGDALLAVRGTNRSFEAITAVAAALVPTYDETEEEWSGLHVTGDPAAHMRHILTGPMTARPQLPVDLVDEEALVAFRQHSIDNDYVVNAVLEGASLWESLRTVASAGNGEPRASDKWGVIWDRDRSSESPIQVVSPRNARGFSFSKAMGIRPGAIIARFQDAAEEWREREITIYDDGLGPNSPDVRYEVRDYPWLDVEAAVAARALYELRNERLRDTGYEAEVAWDGRFLRRGDFIAAQSEVWDVDTGSGIVKTVVLDPSSGNVVGLELDEEVPLHGLPLFNDAEDVASIENVRLLGLTGRVGIRLADGTLISKAIEGDGERSRSIRFTTPFTLPTADFGDGAEPSLVAGSLVTAGVIEYRRMLIAGITARTTETLRLILQDEAPGIFA
ncbi:MAG: hypothetical protein AB7P16_23460 [Bradyrhizobium sp.]|uniref:hypothetical protein n=1 Tax=Bradyrhizobium sp. TaxID=376 RepID=UPI003D0CD28A